MATELRVEREGLVAGESPEYVRMSLAAAMTLGFRGGRFYRNARLHCINLLTTYSEGCVGSCAYCGLSRKRAVPRGGQSFIRVEWPAYTVEEVIERIAREADVVERICVSMITNRRAVEDVGEIVARIRGRLDTPISLLVTPTILNEQLLRRYRALGADKIGIAVDAATPELFDLLRGRKVGGPHRWEVYWELFGRAVPIFGPGNVGAHLIVGLGETEREMVGAMQRAADLGGNTHLFSFFPEAGSHLQELPQPPAGQYRRVQLARFLIDQKASSLGRFAFDELDRIADFGVLDERLQQIIASGAPFLTSGCTGKKGQVACNRPYGDSTPGDDIRSYPFSPGLEDLEKIRAELRDYETTGPGHGGVPARGDACVARGDSGIAG